MFDADISTRSGYDSKAFDFDEVNLVEATSSNNEMWPELVVKSSTLRLRVPGVTFREEGSRLVVCEGGKEQVYFKTPGVVRQLRAHKRDS